MNHKAISFSLMIGLLWAGPAFSAELTWRDLSADGRVIGKPAEVSAFRLKSREDNGVPWMTGPGKITTIPLDSTTQALHVRFRAKAVGGRKGGFDHALKVHLKDSPEKRPFFRCGPYLHGEEEFYSFTATIEEPGKWKDVSLIFSFGWGESDIQVEEVSVTPMDRTPERDEFHREGHWYAGMEETAPWRENARKMIAKHRMADVQVTVVGPGGDPAEDAMVVLEQQAHAYRFGTAVATQRFRWLRETESNFSRESALVANGPAGQPRDRAREMEDAQRFFAEIVGNFNYFVTENGLKAEAWSGDWGGFRMEDTFGAIDYLRAQGLEAKGHVLVWPGWKNAPKYMKTHGGDPEVLDRLVKAHITEIGTAMNGKLASFDVMNEAFNNHDFMDIIGDEVMVEWFVLADKVLPEARLCVNDFLLIANGGRYTEKLDFYENLVQALLDDKAPLDVIGFQNHYRHTFLTAPHRIWELCDRFSRFGLPLECSEFDVSLKDEQLQAAFTRDFLTAWFAHPSTHAFLFWGFWEAEHWLPDAALMTRDWRKKPAYHAYRDLVFNEWWSGWEESQTDDGGQSRKRVFHGVYTITVVKDGITKVLENVTVGPGGLDLIVRL